MFPIAIPHITNSFASYYQKQYHGYSKPDFNASRKAQQDHANRRSNVQIPLYHHEAVRSEVGKLQALTQPTQLTTTMIAQQLTKLPTTDRLEPSSSTTRHLQRPRRTHALLPLQTTNANHGRNHAHTKAQPPPKAGPEQGQNRLNQDRPPIAKALRLAVAGFPKAGTRLRRRRRLRGWLLGIRRLPVYQTRALCYARVFGVSPGYLCAVYY